MTTTLAYAASMIPFGTLLATLTWFARSCN
jgi:hypothetical protein